MWRLSEGGEGSVGVCCTEEGLFLGGTPLIERRGEAYAVRPLGDLERLLRCAYTGDDVLERIIPSLTLVASALAERNLCPAQIAALHLRLPDLPDMAVRRAVEAEDRRIEAEARLARADWDPSEHPRAGTPPNPGWFAPTDGSGSRGGLNVAQGEEDERAPEEMLDPLAPVRQAQWDAAIATLREIDPANPNLTYISNPGSAPSQEALDRLDAALKAAAIRRVTDKVMPGGVPIGQPGSGLDVRELPGNTAEARSCSNTFGSAAQSTDLREI